MPTLTKFEAMSVRDQSAETWQAFLWNSGPRRAAKWGAFNPKTEPLETHIFTLINATRDAYNRRDRTNTFFEILVLSEGKPRARKAGLLQFLADKLSAPETTLARFV